MTIRPWRGALFVILIAALSTSTGCSEKGKKGPKVKTMKGIVKKIDLNNNRVSMSIRDENGKERVLEGVVREDTEVLINGRNQKIEDIKEDDKVEVSGFKEGEGNSSRLIATKVVVTRPTESDWKSTGKSGGNAAKPAGQSAKPAPTGAAPAAVPK